MSDDDHITTYLAEAGWRPVDPTNADGPQIAALWGDPGSGSYGALLRVPAGFESPVHAHSHDERIVVLKGSSVHWTASASRDAAPTMVVGDYMLMRAGVFHVSSATTDGECIEFITQDGPFDFTLQEDA